MNKNDFLRILKDRLFITPFIEPEDRGFKSIVIGRHILNPEIEDFIQNELGAIGIDGNNDGMAKIVSVGGDTYELLDWNKTKDSYGFLFIRRKNGKE